MEDRHELDDAIFETLGLETSNDRKDLRNRLYAYLEEFFEGVRQKEELTTFKQEQV